MKLKSIYPLAVLCSLSLSVCLAQADDGAEQTKAAIREQYPGVAVDSVTESVIKGIYEVVVGQNVVYFHPGTKTLITGELVQNGNSLTAERREKLIEQFVSAKLATFPYDKAIKLGSGPHKIIEVTDPDCAYCRKAFTGLKGRTDLTRYVIFAPLAHPQAITKCQYIIDAKDHQQAFDDMMSGKPLPDGFKPSEKAKKLSEEQLALARELGISGTPTYFINGSMVVGADLPKIEKLLGQGNSTPKK
jgi:thiol:disulfide interchange protein DsbC